MGQQSCNPCLFKLLVNLILEFTARINQDATQGNDPIPELFLLCLNGVIEAENSLKKKSRSKSGRPPPFSQRRSSNPQTDIKQAQLSWLQFLCVQVIK